MKKSEAERKLQKEKRRVCLRECVCVCVYVKAWLTDWPTEAGRDERKVRRCQAEL